MRDRLRIGVVGAGPAVERYHMPAINGVPEVVRNTILDLNAERAQRLAERYGFPHCSASIDELAENVDVAIIAVPNGQHAPMACELLSRGISVLCEKPMARNPEECLRMIEAAQAGRAQLCIGHNRRFRQHISLARRLLRKGLLGNLLRVDAEEGSTSDWPRSPSYFDPRESGGGALMDVGIHAIDLIRWLAGEFQEVEYEGNGTETCAESDALMRFRLASGASGQVVASRTRNLQQRITLTGSEGTLEIGLWDPTLGIRVARGKAFQNHERLELAVSRRPPQDSSFVEQLRNFALAVRGEEDLLVTGEEGMAAVEVVYGAYRGYFARVASRSPGREPKEVSR